MLFAYFTYVAGSRRRRRRYESLALNPHAVGIFSSLLEGHSQGFHASIVGDREGEDKECELRWSGDYTGTGIATFLNRGQAITTAVLLTGQDAEEEAIAVALVQAMIVAVFHDTPLEPGFDLLDLDERPAIVSLLLPGAIGREPGLVATIAEMEKHLAAAFFEAQLIR